MKKLKLVTYSLLLSTTMLSACGTTYKMTREEFNAAYSQGNYCKSTDIILGEEDVCSKSANKIASMGGDLDERMNAGTTLFLSGKNKSSQKLFNEAEKDINEGLNSNSILRGTVEVIANASAMDYNPMVMDSVYVYSYQVLNALALKDKSLVRNEFKRAHETQAKATDVFKKEINKKNEDLKQEISTLSEEITQTLNKGEKLVKKEYSSFDSFKGYTDYVNPYVTYMNALYLMLNAENNDDKENAVNYMKRVNAMVSSNKYVKEDLKLAEDLANNKISSIEPTAWVIYENGQVAYLEEFRLDIPVFLITQGKDRVKTASISLPKPTLRNEAFPYVTVATNNSKNNTQLLANVDNMFIAEFNKKFPTILTKAIIKLAVQTTAQAVAQNKFGDLGGIAASVYSVVTAGADLRSWYTLPKNVQLSKIKKGEDGVINVYANNAKIAKITTPADKHSLIYIRIPEKGSVPYVSAVDL